MTKTQRRLISAALLLIAFGILSGFVQAQLSHYNTLLVLQYQGYWKAATLASQDAPLEMAQAAEHSGYSYTRVVDAHTHLIKVATVLLLITLVYPLIALPEPRKRMLAILFLIGNCAFPLGVLAEIYVRNRSAQALAAAGALLVIAAFAGLLWGLLPKSSRVQNS